MPSWNDPPDFEDVQNTMRKLASSRAHLRMLELGLDLYKARMDRRKPRTPHVRVIGVDEDSEREITELQYEIATARSVVEVLEAEVKFLDYRRDMFKALAYRERL